MFSSEKSIMFCRIQVHYLKFLHPNEATFWWIAILSNHINSCEATNSSNSISSFVLGSPSHPNPHQKKKKTIFDSFMLEGGVHQYIIWTCYMGSPGLRWTPQNDMFYGCKTSVTVLKDLNSLHYSILYGLKLLSAILEKQNMQRWLCKENCLNAQVAVFSSKYLWLKSSLAQLVCHNPLKPFFISFHRS